MPVKKAMPKTKQINPYLKDVEPLPCSYCMLNKKVHNNITSQMSDSIQRIKDNKNNISQKKMFGTSAKTTKKPVKKRGKKKY
tara:strand:+ start:997 stop:1242 length:246 start_codon:yes stop_codon:yes gene_type:complete